ncbi:hypothetical protein EAE96_007888 [Botrytis aclada]|nr:hypothetical protein EAE96_007888 [Botrytis aclada]
MRKQRDQLNESHQKELEALKLDLEEAQTARQKASTECFSKLIEYLTRKAKATELRLDAEQAHTSASLVQQNSKLLEENRRLKQQQSQSTATSSTRLNQLEEKHYNMASAYQSSVAQRDKLRGELARCQRQCQVWKDEAEYYNTSRDDRRAELDEVARELTKTTAKYEKALYNCSWEEHNHDKLKWTYDIVKPLVKIGADIRLRFLDQAREAVLDIPRDETGTALRANGNTAAHKGNVAADLASFKGKFIPEEYEEEAEEIFEKLYKQKSSECLEWTGIPGRKINCHATLQMTKRSETSDNPNGLRDSWGLIWRVMSNGK